MNASSSSDADNESKNESITESRSQEDLFKFSLSSNLNQGSPTIVIKDTPFHPGKSFKFPKTKFGARERSCQYSWFDSYKWLHYTEENDSVVCFICATEDRKGNWKSERMKKYAYIS